MAKDERGQAAGNKMKEDGSMAARGTVNVVNLEKAIASRRSLLVQLEQEVGALETVMELMKSSGRVAKGPRGRDPSGRVAKRQRVKGARPRRKRGRQRLTREDRKEIVRLVFKKAWSSKRVAEKMGVSTVTVQKVCREAGKPIPRGRGKKKQ